MVVKRIVVFLIVCSFVVAGCSTTTKTGAAVGAAVGTVVGAGVGYAVGGSKGAVIGAGAGLAVGTLAGMGVGRYMDKQEQELQQTLAQSEAAAVKREQDVLIVTFKADVMFDFDSASVKPGAQDEVRRVADVLYKYPETRIRIEGHTDSVGAEEYNLKLSERRAMAVKNELIGQNVQPERIVTVGFGEAKPVAANDTPEGRQQNRRVRVVIIPNETQG